MRIRIGIIAAARPGGVDLLSKTIHFMRSWDEIARHAEYGLFFDGLITEAPTWTEHLDLAAYRTADELAKLRSVTYHGGSNLARALRWASEADIAVVSEDDYVMGPRWASRGLALLEATGTSSFVCLSHLWAQMYPFLYETTDLVVENLTLYRFKNTMSTPNGFSPCFMDGAAAARIADAIDKSHGPVEPDLALMFGGRDSVVSGFVCDPCIASHMNIASTYDPNRDNWAGKTKRFSPI